MYYSDEENEKIKIELINDSKRLFEKQKSEVEDAKKVLDLCEVDLCRNKQRLHYQKRSNRTVEQEKVKL